MSRPFWRITLFGGLRVFHDGVQLPRFDTRKAAAVFAFLSLDPGRVRDRGELAAAFWGEDEPELSRTSLRQSLASMRRTLGDSTEDPVVKADRISVHLDEGQIEVDASEFSRLVKLDDVDSLMQATSLYTGPLLPEFSDDPFPTERIRFAEAAIAAHERLATLLTERGDHERGIRAAEAAVALDPLRESSASLLIKILNHAGKTSESARVYHTFEERLRKQLGLAPSERFKSLATNLAKSSRPRPERSFTSNIAAPLTPMFGRREELERACSILARDNEAIRVLTLTGPGGIGKTKLARETAWKLRDEYDGASWWVPLADIDDLPPMARRIADALGVTADPGDEARRIAGYIGEYPALLFLDNFEQLVPEGITLVQSLAESCPRLKVVVTSRERLDIGFDHELPLAPLSAPDASDLADRIAEMPSVQLFLDRASQAGAPLTLTEGTASDIAAICRKLEGIPLALVLAGARARMLGPRQMLDALEDRFAVLATKRRDLPERQRTLGASIRWSYQLLPDYKHFFACLGVFRGGFTMESAAAVACSDAEEPLRHLVDCSLVIFRPTDKRPRFGMLETIREFAESRLHGGTLREVRSNHARFFAELAQKATAEALTSKQQEWIATLAEEEANIREALRWSIENDPNVALRLVDGLWFYWNAGANWREARDWLSAAVSLATGETDPIDLARAYQGLGAMERRLGNLEAARNALRKSVEIYQAAGERRLIARPLNSLGVLELGEGNFDEAEKYFAEALHIVEEAGDDRLVAMVQANLGDLDVRLNRLEEAKSHLETALSLNRKTSNRVWEASNLATLAEIAEASSDCESALRLLDESLTIQDDLDLPRSATTLKTKGLVLARMQRSDEALQTMREEAKCLDESGDAKGLAACLARAADLLDSLGEAERANALRAIDDSNARAFAELIFPSDEISR